jgi:hypothetical protein
VPVHRHQEGEAQHEAGGVDGGRPRPPRRRPVGGRRRRRHRDGWSGSRRGGDALNTRATSVAAR